MHTVLSPCAELEMIPPLIVQTALDKGVQVLAITDHNASSNVEAVIEAAQGTDLVILPGIEVQTKEDIHTVCIFDSLDQLFALQKTIDNRLPDLPNDPDHLGVQLIVDENGDFKGFENRLLLTSIDLSLTDLYGEVMRNEGLFIPAHVDREAFGMIRTLGFIPTDIDIQIVEISKNIGRAEAIKKFPQLAGLPMIQSGDAHRLDEILGLNLISMKNPCVAEIKKSLLENQYQYLEIGPKER